MNSLCVSSLEYKMWGKGQGVKFRFIETKPAVWSPVERPACRPLRRGSHGFIKMLSLKQPLPRGTVMFTEKTEPELKEILLKPQYLSL